MLDGGGLPVISAGFVCDDCWCGGESETLKIGSRKKDLGLLVSMLQSTAREVYDLLPAEVEPPVHELEPPPPAPPPGRRPGPSAKGQALWTPCSLRWL